MSADQTSTNSTTLPEGAYVMFFRNAVYGEVMKGPERCAGSDDMYLVQTGVGKAEWVHRDSLRIVDPRSPWKSA